MKRFICILISLFLTLVDISAHEVRPAFLHVTQVDTAQYSIIWKVPRNAGRTLAIQPIFPQGFDVRLEKEYEKPGFVISSFTAHTNVSLPGKSIVIQHLEKTLVDVLIRIDLLQDISHSFILQPDKPRVVIPHQPNSFEVFKSYLILGFEHILLGYDHLLFVLALLLLVPSFKSLLLTITSFTIAHSITLGLASLDLVTLPSSPVEAVIALSIIFLAREFLQVINGIDSLTAKYPWSVSFTFGLLHGFGFAGALAEIGFPQQNLFTALLSFNIGVELGQIAFVLGCLLLYYVTKAIGLAKYTKPQRQVVSYTIGGISSFWLIERMCSIIF